MQEIETEIKAGRYAIACRELEKLLSWKSDPKGGIVYLLGSCELARGRPAAAGEAGAGRSRFRLRGASDSRTHASLARFRTNCAPNSSSSSPPAIAAMIRRHFACCSCRSTASSAASMRQNVSSNSGGNISRAIGEGSLEPAIKLLRLHIELTEKAMPVEEVRASIDAAARNAPDDDRVWLGQANLAIRTGDFDAARRRLDDCLRRRPDDLPTGADHRTGASRPTRSPWRKKHSRIWRLPG